LELLRSSDNDSLERRAIVVVIVVEKILSSSKRIESEVAAVVDIAEHCDVALGRSLNDSQG
jgi:hypothetical protein